MAEENVYLFAPNLIGYARILLALFSFYVMPTNHIAATWAYILSGLLDAVDGHVARVLNQSSRFGAFLDMLTDRCATMCLLVVLCLFYPAWTFFFQISMVIDIASHWIHTQSAQIKGKSHKIIDLAGNPVLRHYYTNKMILFAMCAGNELFYAMLYLLHFTSGPEIGFGALSVGLFKIICILCFPIAIVKSLISLVQLFAACENVVAIDIEERKAAALQSAKKQ